MNLGTVIVADDDASIRTVLNHALARAGFLVRTTGNAATLWRWRRNCGAAACASMCTRKRIDWGSSSSTRRAVTCRLSPSLETMNGRGARWP